jgi:hypothetical protein
MQALVIRCCCPCSDNRPSHRKSGPTVPGGTRSTGHEPLVRLERVGKIGHRSRRTPLYELRPAVLPGPRAGITFCPGPDRGTAAIADGPVVKVVDGETIDVPLDGRTVRVRSLGGNAPETKHPTKGGEPLRRQLPTGRWSRATRCVLSSTSDIGIPCVPRACWLVSMVVT